MSRFKPNQEYIDKLLLTKKCQEASLFSKETFIPCNGTPVVAIIANSDAHPYYMCAQCMDHNAINRGGIIVAIKGGEL